MHRHRVECGCCDAFFDVLTRAHPRNDGWRLAPPERINNAGFYVLDNLVNSTDDIILNEYVSFICHDCFESNDDYVRVNDIVTHEDNVVIDGNGDKQVQDDCWQCGDCEEFYHSENVWHETVGGETICEHCRDNGEWTYTCDNDCYLVHYDDTFSCQECGEVYAGEDYALECCGGRRGDWHCYSANVFHELGNYYVDISRDQSLRFDNVAGTVAMRHKPTHLLVYGVENEIECRHGMDDLADAMRDSSSNVAEYSILKEDSSISGLELVTLPATLAAHQRHIEWATFCDNTKPVGRGHYGSGNGMHIHCDRTAIGSLTLGKLLVFFNSQSNSQLLTDIAQREIHSHNQWCRQSPDIYDKCGKSGKNPSVSGKYSALNVTSYTVECRIFNATLVPERILKNIEFFDAAIQWCRVTPVSVIESQTSRDSFLQFVVFNRKQYPHLHEFLLRCYGPYRAYPENKRDADRLQKRAA